MKLETLRDLLIEQLRHLYQAENQLLKGLPRMARASSGPELQKVLDACHEKAQQHVFQLEEIFSDLDARAKEKKCQGMRGLIREVKELIADNPEPEVLDSGLLAIAQKIEHYEIACSGTLKTWAEELGIPRVASLLGSILEDALVLAQKLTALAIHRVNRQAVVGKVPVEPDGVEPESAPVTTREENLQQGKDADESGEKVP